MPEGYTGGGANAIKVSDEATKKATEKVVEKNTIKRAWEALTAGELSEFLSIVWTEGGSSAFWKAVSSGLNTLAYDTATWIGSGEKGQKPMFITEGWGEYLTNIGDNAAGTFMEQMGKKWNFNLCEPDFALKMKIGLGLVQYHRPKKPACTFREMKKNWQKELKDPKFLSKFQDMFNPTSNDLGIALSLQTGMMEDIDLNKALGREKRIAGGGWLDVSNPITGYSTSPPGESSSGGGEKE